VSKGERTLVNASSKRIRVALSDGSEFVAEPWSLTRVASELRVERSEVVHEEPAS
jgi:hypothetical protein